MKLLRLMLAGTLCILLATGCSSVKDAVHRLRYGNDRVTYHGRTYYEPTTKTSENLPVSAKELVPTGEKVMGLPVYDTESSIQFQKERNVVPTGFILKESDDNFIVYALSGGP